MNARRLSLNKMKFHEIWLTLISIIILELSGTVVCSVMNENDISKKLSLVLAGMLVPYVVKTISRKKNLNRIIYCIIGISLFVAINLFVYSTNTTRQALIFRGIWFVLFFSTVIYLDGIRDVFLKYLYNATLIVAYFTLIMFVVIELFSIGLPFRVAGNSFVPYHVYFGGFSIYTGHSIHLLSLPIYRLAGIFWEPGIYEIFLNLAIFYYCFYCPKRNKLSFIILIVNLVLTFSTTGYSVFVIIFSLWFSRNRSFAKNKNIMVGFGVVFAALLVYSIIIDKKTGEYGGSYSLRMSDMIIGLQLFRQNNILLGVGYNNTGIFEIAQGLGRGNSNGLTTWLYTMGVLGLMVVVFPFIRNIITERNKDERINRILFFGIFLVFNMSEPIYFAPVMWLIVAQEYANKSHSKNASIISKNIKGKNESILARKNIPN